MEIFYSNDIKSGIITLSGEESAHCIRVLRNRKGDQVKVSGGDGNLYLCEIEDDNPSGAKLKIISVEGGFGKHNYFLHVAVAPTKNTDRFEWFLEKATELGIDEITPLLCDHSVRTVLKAERCERVILAAAKQSLKGAVPVLNPLTPAKEFIAQSATFEGAKLIAYCDSELIDAQGTSIKRVPIVQALAPRAMVLIGPEGDFSLPEIQVAAAQGFIPISLGDSRLRTETAALTAVAAEYLKYI